MLVASRCQAEAAAAAEVSAREACAADIGILPGSDAIPGLMRDESASEAAEVWKARPGV
jgi:hypothetical protein